MENYKSQHRYSLAVKCLYIALQTINLILSFLTLILLFLSFPSLRIKLSPLFLALALTIYLLLRNINYKICRLFGYHASPKLVDYGQTVSYDGVTLPTFEKITENYKVIYRTRHVGFQSLFYFFFMALNAGLIALYGFLAELIFLYAKITTQAAVYIYGLGGAVAIFIIIFIQIRLNKELQKYFAKWFHLKVILMEHEQPIYAKKENYWH
ncbi:hypothetical protein ACVRWB_02890 [Streptococcus troglodytae]